MADGKEVRPGSEREEKPIARIHILGCHHALQSVEICLRWTWAREAYERIGKNVDELARQQKDRFAARVHEIVEGRAVTIIGEEFDEGIVTSASLAVPNWHMIDMPRAVRYQQEIPFEYTDRDCYSQEQIARWNRERERYMFDEFVRCLGHENNGLLICGTEHRQALAGLFGKAGHEVTSEDITTADWFDPPL